MATAFEKLIANYGKIKQFPIGENLMPLADPQANEEQTDIPPPGTACMRASRASTANGSTTKGLSLSQVSLWTVR